MTDSPIHSFPPHPPGKTTRCWYTVSADGAVQGPYSFQEVEARRLSLGAGGMVLCAGQEPLFSHDELGFAELRNEQLLGEPGGAAPVAPVSSALWEDKELLDHLVKTIFSKKKIWNACGSFHFKAALKGLPVLDYSPAFSAAPATEPGGSGGGGTLDGEVEFPSPRFSFSHLHRLMVPGMHLVGALGLLFAGLWSFRAGEGVVGGGRSPDASGGFSLRAASLAPTGLVQLTAGVKSALDLDYVGYARALAHLSLEREHFSGATLPDLGETAAWIFTFLDAKRDEEVARAFVKSLDPGDKRGLVTMALEAGFSSGLLKSYFEKAYAQGSSLSKADFLSVGSLWGVPPPKRGAPGRNPDQHQTRQRQVPQKAPSSSAAGFEPGIIDLRRVAQGIQMTWEEFAKETSPQRLSLKQQLLAESIWNAVQISWFFSDLVVKENWGSEVGRWLEMVRELPSPDKEILSLILIERSRVFNNVFQPIASVLSERKQLFDFLKNDWGGFCAPRQSALMGLALVQTALIQSVAPDRALSPGLKSWERCGVHGALVDPTVALLNQKNKLEDIQQNQSILYLKFPGSSLAILPTVLKELGSRWSTKSTESDLEWLAWLRVAAAPLFSVPISGAQKALLDKKCAQKLWPQGVCLQGEWIQGHPAQQINLLGRIEEVLSVRAAQDGAVRLAISQKKRTETFDKGPLKKFLPGDSARLDALEWLRSQGVESSGEGHLP